MKDQSKLQKGNRTLVSIAAMSDNEVIAVNGKIPWHLPNDFKHFKQVTEGHHIIMGRKTFESLPGLLPNRCHIIVTTNKDYKPNTTGSQQKNCPIIVVHNLQQAIDICPFNKASYIIGGGEIYKQAMSIVDYLDLTVVQTHIHFKSSDVVTYFPSSAKHINDFDFEKMFDEVYYKDDKHQYDYRFVTLKRKDTSDREIIDSVDWDKAKPLNEYFDDGDKDQGDPNNWKTTSQTTLESHQPIEGKSYYPHNKVQDIKYPDHE